MGAALGPFLLVGLFLHLIPFLLFLIQRPLEEPDLLQELDPVLEIFPEFPQLDPMSRGIQGFFPPFPAVFCKKGMLLKAHGFCRLFHFPEQIFLIRFFLFRLFPEVCPDPTGLRA